MNVIFETFGVVVALLLAIAALIFGANSCDNSMKQNRAEAECSNFCHPTKIAGAVIMGYTLEQRPVYGCICQGPTYKQSRLIVVGE